MSHEGCYVIASIVLFKKTCSRIHKQQDYNTQKSSGIPYRYISYESIIKPKTKKTTKWNNNKQSWKQQKEYGHMNSS
jgi:hypothetical protein